MGLLFGGIDYMAFGNFYSPVLVSALPGEKIFSYFL